MSKEINISTNLVKECFQIIKNESPIKQEDIDKSLDRNMTEREKQEVVRQLRNNSLAVYTKDRRVDVTEERFKIDDFNMFP